MFDTWESYFYPPPDNATMRNIQELRNPQALHMFEYGATALRQKQLYMAPSLVSHTYDAEHVRAIHRHLFQDVYEWAGHYRTVNMGKGMSSFANVRAGEVDRYLADMHRIVERTEWARLGRADFSHAAATVFAYLNQAHPFREGNGRTSKVFMEHVAEQSRFTLDFTRVTPDSWNTASMLSGPERGRYEPRPDPLVPVFSTVAVERTGSPAPSSESAARSRLLANADYLQPPSRAVQKRPDTSSSGPVARSAHRRGRGYGSTGQGVGR